MSDLDELAAFEQPRVEPRDDPPPELVWLQDTTDGLDAFAPRQPAPAVPPPAPARAVPDAIDEPEERSWMLRASLSAVLCLVLAAFADGLLDLDVLPWGRPAAPVVSATVADASPLEVRPTATAGRLALARPVAMAAPDRAGDVSAEATTAPAVVPAAVAPSRAVSAAPPRDRAFSTTGRAVPAPAPSVAPRVDAPVTVPAMAASTPAATLAPPDTTASVPPVPAATVATAPTTPAVTAPIAPAPEVASARPATPAITNTASAAPIAPPRDRDARAVQTVLGQYRAAFNTLDATAAQAIWPTVNEKTLARAFDRLADQTVSFDACDIDVTAGLAEAACRGTARYVPKVGSRTPKAEAREWRFTLRKADTGWLIDRVDAR